MATSLRDLLDAPGVVVLDGATATNLHAAGLDDAVAPERWNDEHPERVRELHRAFVRAGAEVVLTNSFGVDGYAPARRAAELARRAVADADRAVVIAGSVGPCAPAGALAARVRGLRDGGADVLWFETVSSAAQVRASCDAAAAVGAPFVVTCSFHVGGRTAAGMTPRELAALVEALPSTPLAIGANCGNGPGDVLAAAGELVAAAGPGMAVVAKPSAGLPVIDAGRADHPVTPAAMAAFVREAAAAGVRLVGGCCGTTPAHVAAMRAALGG